MKAILILSTLLPVALAATPSNNILNTNRPIYLNEVFWPPAMTFVAWLPSEEGGLLEWCNPATDASNHKLFSLGEINALQIHEHF
jgi:hypothetical protein